MFTCRHYKVIAQAINDSRKSENEPDSISAYWLIKMLSTIFKLDNSRFNADTFRKACGEQPTEH